MRLVEPQSRHAEKDSLRQAWRVAPIRPTSLAACSMSKIGSSMPNRRRISGFCVLSRRSAATDRTDPKAAKYFILQVADFVSRHRFDEGLSRGIVERRIKDHPDLLRHVHRKADRP